MGRDTNEAVRRKYIELYQRAAAALGSGKKFRSKAEFRREIGATEMELKTVFRKYPELEEIWNAREIPVRRGIKKRQRKAMDPLVRDAIEAREMGMSYGIWRAMQEEGRNRDGSRNRGVVSGSGRGKEYI